MRIVTRTMHVLSKEIGGLTFEPWGMALCGWDAPMTCMTTDEKKVLCKTCKKIFKSRKHKPL